MNSHHTAVPNNPVPFRVLFTRALRGGLICWISMVVAGFLMASLHWPIPLIEGLYGFAVWGATVALAPILNLISSCIGVNDSVWEHWGWVLGACAWLPLIVAFRFAHLVAMHPQRTE